MAQRVQPQPNGDQPGGSQSPPASTSETMEHRLHACRLMRRAVTTNDRRAFYAAVALVSPELYREARRLVTAPYVDDLVNKTLVRGWALRAGLAQVANAQAEPLAWLTHIMATVAANATLSPSDTAFGRPLGTEAVNAVEDIATYLRAQAVEEALGKLDPLHQELIRRRHLKGQDWATITRETGFRNSYFTQQAYAEAKAALAALLDIAPQP